MLQSAWITTGSQVQAFLYRHGIEYINDYEYMFYSSSCSVDIILHSDPHIYLFIKCTVKLTVFSLDYIYGFSLMTLSHVWTCTNLILS